jgi:DNA-binding transcriptional LysR family regulator
MEDLNDIYFFASVVQFGGFSAAARKIGVEKTRLSRRIAFLEKRLGVRLLQRTTRALALTEAGQRFFERCVATVEGAQAAYDSVAELRREPAGLVRLSSPVLLTQRCLAHALPGYMTLHPKVSVFVEPTDRTVNVIEERFDIAIRAKPEIEDGRAGGEDSRYVPTRAGRQSRLFSTTMGARKVPPTCRSSTRSPAPTIYSTAGRDGT